MITYKGTPHAQFLRYILYTACLLAASLITGCQGTSTPQPGGISLTPAGTEATDPYMTSDHLGNPVLCWTEKEPENGQYLLKYAVFNASREEFGPAVTVSPSTGTKTSAESANKVAFKSDGSIVALFGKRFEDPENRFAGGIMYSLSRDQGKNWSAPLYLHSDTLHRYGRGFFDISTLPDGETGAIWLDGRYGEADTGSALFFARTEKGKGFGPDKVIGKSTCECCRTDILADTAGIIHVAYRDIRYPLNRFGKQVRDMACCFSRDNGKTFSEPRLISADNWEIAGCPHSGPSLALNRAGLQAIWFTAGGNPGVYQASAAETGQPFTPRKLLSAEARHPQMISLPDGDIATVWEEISLKEENHPAGTHEGHPGEATHAAGAHQAGGSDQEVHSGHNMGMAAAASAIVLQHHSEAGIPKKLLLTDGKNPAHHPVLAATGPQSLIVAWVEEVNGLPSIKYCMVDL